MAKKKTGFSANPPKTPVNLNPEPTKIGLTSPFKPIEDALPVLKGILIPFQAFNLQAFILILATFLTFGNSLSNEFAADDLMVVVRNQYVHKGIAGIPEILKYDSFQGFFGSDKKLLPGGRWRPLALVTYAIEYELFATEFNPKENNEEFRTLDGKMPTRKPNAFVGHFVNLLLYAGLAVLLLYLLRTYFFKTIPELAFISLLLFVVHPLHAEVVANIKSRDEILSLLFLSLTLLFIFRTIENPKLLNWGLASLFYFLALLAKENGITFFFIIPLTLYCFTNLKFERIFTIMLPLIVVIGVYLYLRGKATGGYNLTGGNTDILNNPYIRSGFLEKYGTISWVLFEYLWLFIYPYPLAWDYSFAQVPYVKFNDFQSILGFFLHAFGLVWSLMIIRNKNKWSGKSFNFRLIFAYAILFYLLSISIISNAFVNLGAPMGERLLFQGSLMLCVIVAALLLLLAQRMNKYILLALFFVITTAYGARSFYRSADWHSNFTLYLRDVNASPNSVKTNLAAAQQLTKSIKDGSANTPGKRDTVFMAMTHIRKALEKHRDFTDAYIDMGLAYFMLDSLQKAEENWDEVLKRYPTQQFLPRCYASLSEAYFRRANKAFERNDIDSAEFYLLRTIGIKFNQNPHGELAATNLAAIYANNEKKRDWNKVAFYLKRATEINPGSVRHWIGLSNAYNNAGQLQNARQAIQRAAQLEPNNKEIQAMLAAFPK